MHPSESIFASATSSTVTALILKGMRGVAWIGLRVLPTWAQMPSSICATPAKYQNKENATQCAQLDCALPETSVTILQLEPGESQGLTD